MKKLDIQPCIHILDCTKVLVNLDSDNYEESSVVKIDGETMRGYKLGVLRGVLDDSGIAEDIVFGTRCQLCFPMQNPRSVDSVVLLSNGTSPSSRNTRRYLSWFNE